VCDGFSRSSVCYIAIAVVGKRAHVENEIFIAPLQAWAVEEGFGKNTIRKRFAENVHICLAWSIDVFHFWGRSGETAPLQAAGVFFRQS
jgi:hypothetical protein